MTEYSKVKLEMRVWRQQQVEINKRLHHGQKWLDDNSEQSVKNQTDALKEEFRKSTKENPKYAYHRRKTKTRNKDSLK